MYFLSSVNNKNISIDQNRDHAPLKTDVKVFLMINRILNVRVSNFDQ